MERKSSCNFVVFYVIIQAFVKSIREIVVYEGHCPHIRPPGAREDRPA